MKAMLIRVLLIVAVVIPVTAADASGKWECVIQWKSGPSGMPVFTLKQDGQKLSGTYEGGLGTTPVTGTIKGETVDLSLTNPKGTMRFTAKLAANGGQMTGKATFKLIDGTADEGTFTAKRR